MGTYGATATGYKMLFNHSYFSGYLNIYNLDSTVKMIASETKEK